jgi:hypothetical protein
MVAITDSPVRARGPARAWRYLAILLFLGVPLVVVQQVRIDCEAVLLTDERNGAVLTTEEGRPLTTGEKQCTLVAGEFRLALPRWTQPAIWSP